MGDFFVLYQDGPTSKVLPTSEHTQHRCGAWCGVLR